jgi:iduronate 2-sulfatase
MEMAALNVPDEATTDGHIARRISDLMETASKGEKPFLLAAGFRRPHLLWVAPKKYFDLYDWHNIPLPQEPEHLQDVPKMALTRGAPNMTDEQRKKAIASYYACVSEVDAQIGVLLASMDRLKLWDNTIVVLTSDHGWHLYEHGLWGKVTLFDVAARVPLIILAPGVTKPGATCARPIEMLDFYPTLAELAGLPAPEKIDGQSIVPLLKDPQSPRDRPAFSVLRRGNKWGKAVYTQRYRYAEYANDASAGAELYDLESDPHEYYNLVKDPAHAKTVAELKKLLYSTVNLKDQAPTTEGATD